jgi:hypothetical protein
VHSVRKERTQQIITKEDKPSLSSRQCNKKAILANPATQKPNKLRHGILLSRPKTPQIEFTKF